MTNYLRFSEATYLVASPEVSARPKRFLVAPNAKYIAKEPHGALWSPMGAVAANASNACNTSNAYIKGVINGALDSK